MRIYTNILEAVREIERDLFEMGIDVHPQSMQNKNVAENPDYITKEVQGYALKIQRSIWTTANEEAVIHYLFKDEKAAANVLRYIALEFSDRISGHAYNPGNSYLARAEVWNEFLVGGKFHYTYSERMVYQIPLILKEMEKNPDTRQAIINLHSFICPDQKASAAFLSADAFHIGGAGRIPCSMYYQFMIRGGAVDLIYTMRSCDFLTHFPVDLMLALRLQKYFADTLSRPVGNFTYFAGSLHAYAKDMKARGIF